MNKSNHSKGVILIILFLIKGISLAFAGNNEKVEITSPNRKIKVLIDVHSHANKLADSITYSIVYYKDNKPVEVLSQSALGLGWNNHKVNKPLFYTGATRSRSVHDSYQMITGKRKACSNDASERTLSFTTNQSDSLRIVFRVYNDGIAFRYVLSGNKKDSVNITGEATTFSIPHSSKRWLQKYTGGYEGFYDNTSVTTGYWGFPALFQTADTACWSLITEANVTTQDFASRLSNKRDADVYDVSLPEPGNYYRDTAATSVKPWSSAWRIVIIGKLSDIVESTLVTDVSDASEIKDAGWIKPGTVSWIYWANNHGSKDYKLVRSYVDLAVNMHWPYVLIDWEWDQMSNGGTIIDAVAYAKSKGIQPLLWYNSGSSWLDPTPVDRLLTHEKREKEFAWLQSIGVKGVKVDFFDGDQQSMMKYYHDILQDAAKYKLLVDFHGCTVPKGWARTYPNLMSMEAVYGAEWYNNNEILTDKAAAHNTTLPFTRNVVGSMDYTPVTFSNSQHAHITSYAHELALSVIFESGLQHMADRPEAYYSLPPDVKQFLQQVPVAWDETKLIDGYPDEKAILARRKGNTWYVAGINGRNEAAQLQADFSFLGNKNYSFHLIRDGKNEQSFSSENIRVSKNKKIMIDCLRRGGFAGIITLSN